VEVWTIGHSTHEADTFIKLLQQHSITMLVDVRTKPSSRKPHFCRDNLIRLVRGNGIDYRFGGSVLGGLNKVKIGEKLFISKMEAILQFAAEGQRVAMMCSEGKPCDCHRAGKLTAWLHREHPEVKTTHILTDGSTVDAKEYEPQVRPVVVWPEFERDAKGKLIL
jgi:uncharacterized protein (DUF488 family)